MILSLLLTIAVTIVAVMFSLENTTMIHITLFGYPVDGSSGLLMLIALAVGVLLGVLLMVPSLIGRSWALMRHRRKIAELEQGPQPKKTPAKKNP